MKLIIENKEYKLPVRLKIDEWSKLAQWDFEDELNWPHILHIYSGAPIDKLKSAKREALELGVSLCAATMSLRVEHKGKDLQSLLFGEWIDMEVLISKGIAKSLQEVSVVLETHTQWADEAIYVYEQYLKWRNTIYRSYANLFGTEDTEEEDPRDQKDPHAIQRAWYRIIVGLADGNILNIDAVIEQPIIKTLNFLALEKQMNLEDQARLVQQQRKYDLQRTR